MSPKVGGTKKKKFADDLKSVVSKKLYKKLIVARNLFSNIFSTLLVKENSVFFGEGRLKKISLGRKTSNFTLFFRFIFLFSLTGYFHLTA